jgi:hypothetical protein
MSISATAEIAARSGSLVVQDCDSDCDSPATPRQDYAQPRGSMAWRYQLPKLRVASSSLVVRFARAARISLA